MLYTDSNSQVGMDAGLACFLVFFSSNLHLYFQILVFLNALMDFDRVFKNSLHAGPCMCVQYGGIGGGKIGGLGAKALIVSTKGGLAPLKIKWPGKRIGAANCEKGQYTLIERSNILIS